MRKKFTMLFAALLCVGATWAQTLISDASNLSNEKVYTVKAACNASTGAWSVASDGSKMSLTMYTEENADGTTMNQRFAFLKHDGHVYLYSLGAKKFVMKSGNGQALSEGVSAASYITFAASSETPDAGHNYVQAEYPLVVFVGGGALCSTNQSHFASHGGIVTNWNNKGDSGNAVAIVEHEPTTEELEALAEGYGKLATVDLTINYVFGETQVKQQVVTAQANQPFNVPVLDYTKIASCKIGEEEQTVTDGACTITVPNAAATVTVELEANLPFAVSADYESATWYAVQIRGTKYMSKTNDGVKVSNATPTTEEALWAFVGDPFTGFTVLNKAAGDGFTLANDNGIKMKDGEAFVWNIYKGNGGFMLREGTTGNNYIHNVGGGEGLGYWDNNATTTDNGSAFVVTSEAEMISLATTAMGLASKLDTYAEASYYTYPNAAVAEAKATLQGVATPTDFLTALNAKAKAEAAQKILTDAGKSGAPAVGDFIILKNKAKNEYMTTMESGDEVHRTSDKNNPKALWQVVAGDDSKVKLYNVASEKYLGAISQSAKVLMVDEANAAQFTFSNQADAYAAFTSGGGHYTYAHMDGWYDRVVGWEAVSDASQWIVTNVRPLSVIYKYNDKVLSETTEYVEVGTYTVSSPYAYTKPGTCTKNDEALVAVDGVFSFELTEATTLIVELVDDLPFVPAADFASITNWYYIKFDSKKNIYLYHDGEKDHIALDQKTVDRYNRDVYTWAFVGNPFDGFKVYNKATGDEKILSSSTTMEGETGAGTYPVMTGVPVPEGNNEYWVLSKSTHAQNGFFMAQKDHASNRMNNRGNKLAYWTGGADTGSTFVVELRNDDAVLQALIDAAEASLVAWDYTEVGYVTISAEHKAAIENAIATAEAAIENKTGYVEAEDALNAAVAAAQPYTIQPEEGVFYTLKNNHTSRYMNVNATAGLIATTAVGIGEVFQFVKDNDNLYLKNVERGTYLSTALPHTWGQNAAGATTIADAKAVVVNNLGKDNQVSITPVGGGQLHHDTNNNNVVAWNADVAVDSKSSWSIEAVDITGLAHVVSISDVKWASLVLGYDAIIPDGVTAYAVTEAGDGVAKLTEVTGAIPAFEAVLLNAAEAGSYRFEYATSADAVADNLLAGSTVNTNVEGLGYVLSAPEGKVGLYKAALNVSTDKTNDGTAEEPAVTYEAFLNNAFKAYLPISSENAPAMFSFSRGGEEEDTTAIDQLINASGELVIYDLSGRRVQKMEKGIYIVNGKKVIR